LLSPLSTWTVRDFTAHYDDSVAQLRRAVEIRPDDAEAHFGLAFALVSLNRIDEAMAHYRQGLKIQPDNADAHENLGVALARRGQADEAIAHFQQALKINPDNADAHNNLGNTLIDRGRFEEALAQYKQAVELDPHFAEARCNLGNVLERLGRFEEAMAHYRRALEIAPDNVGAQKNFSWLRATCPLASLRNGAEAIELAQRANHLSGGKRSDVLDTLAAAYAEAGWFPEALATAHKALELVTQQNASVLADAMRSRIALYEAGKPYRQALPDSAPSR
jgi:tetratricopeptide (TPR) repeat protein